MKEALSEEKDRRDELQDQSNLRKNVKSIAVNKAELPKTHRMKVEILLRRRGAKET